MAAGSTSALGSTESWVAASRLIWSDDGLSSAATLSTRFASISARSPRSRNSRSSLADRSAACGGRRPLTYRML